MKILTLFIVLSFLASCTDIYHQSENKDTALTGTVKAVALAPLELWEEQKFSGSTRYSLIDANGKPEIKAQTSGTASMLLQQLPVDLNETPFLNWEWKVSNVFDIDNEKLRTGDDFPARIYIAIKNKNFSIYPRALNYVWANHSSLLSSWKNPYSSDVVMFTLQSGDANVGQWLSEKRDLKKDLNDIFGEEIDAIEGIAIMTDADNSQLAATAFYRNIYFSAE